MAERWTPTPTTTRWDQPTPATTTIGGPYTAVLGTAPARLGHIELGVIGPHTTTIPRDRWPAAGTTARWE